MQVRGHLRLESAIFQGLGHEVHPTVASALVDGEWHVAHAEPRVSALLDVPLRPAEATHQEVAQAPPGGFQFLRGVHRA